MSACEELAKLGHRPSQAEYRFPDVPFPVALPLYTVLRKAYGCYEVLVERVFSGTKQDAVRQLLFSSDLKLFMRSVQDSLSFLEARETTLKGSGADASEVTGAMLHLFKVLCKHSDSDSWHRLVALLKMNAPRAAYIAEAAFTHIEEGQLLDSLNTPKNVALSPPKIQI